MAAGSRPVGVLIVAILAWISGVLDVIAGIIILVSGVAIPLPWLPWFTIIIGILTFAVALGLFRGSNIARIIITVVFLVGLIEDVIVIFATPGQAWSGIVGAVFKIIGLILLYTRAANEFFRD